MDLLAKQTIKTIKDKKYELEQYPKWVNCHVLNYIREAKANKVDLMQIIKTVNECWDVFRLELNDVPLGYVDCQLHVKCKYSEWYHDKCGYSDDIFTGILEEFGDLCDEDDVDVQYGACYLNDHWWKN